MIRFRRFLPIAFLLITAEQLSAASPKPPGPFNKTCSLNTSCSFTGFQLGLVGGGSVGRTEIVEPTASPVTNNGVMAATGFAGGVNIGYGAVKGKIFFGGDVGLIQDWASDTCLVLDGEMKIRRKSPFYIAPKIGIQYGVSLPYFRFGYTNSVYKLSLRRNTKESIITDYRDSIMIGAGFDALVTPRFVTGLGYDIIRHNKRKKT